MSSRTCRRAGGPDLAGWPGAQCSAERLDSLGSLQALGPPVLSWSQGTPYLILAGEEPAGEEPRVLQLDLGLESGSGQEGGQGDILMGSKDGSQKEDSDMGTETELILSSPPETQPEPGPWGHPQTAWLH